MSSPLLPFATTAHGPHKPLHRMATIADKKTEVFQVSLSVERQWVREVSKAVLGTILFHRILGNLKPRSVEVCGVTFPAASDNDIDSLINAHVETFTRTLLESSRPSKLVVCFYPTPKAPLAFRSPTTLLTSKSPSPSRATPVTSALGWFSASAKAALGHEDSSTTTSERDELEEFGAPWEAWIVEIDVVGDGRRGIGEDRLRSQLNDFLLRSLSFVMEKTSHVPPITSAETLPHGVLIGVDPQSLPFIPPKPMISNPTWPLLQDKLVNSARNSPNRKEGYAR